MDTRSSWTQSLPKSYAASDVDVDVGLRSHMLKVYNLMTSGVLLSAIVSLLLVKTGLVDIFFVKSGRNISPTILGYIAMFSPLVFSLVLSFGAHKMSKSTMTMLFWGYATAIGLSFSSMLLLFTGASVAQAFFVATAAFAGLSLVGYTTSKNLSGLGVFLIMGLIGMLVLGLVNIFIGSSLLSTLISAAGVLIFSGLAAYDTQRIKNDYLTGQSMPAIFDAFIMYTTFVGLFQSLMNLLGNRQE